VVAAAIERSVTAAGLGGSSGGAAQIGEDGEHAPVGIGVGVEAVTSGRSPIGTLREDESIRSVGLPPVGKEVRMAPMRVGSAGMPKRQPSALVAIGVHWM
jgi:hypothetical protein